MQAGDLAGACLITISKPHALGLSAHSVQGAQPAPLARPAKLVPASEPGSGRRAQLKHILAAGGEHAPGI